MTWLLAGLHQRWSIPSQITSKIPNLAKVTRITRRLSHFLGNHWFGFRNDSSLLLRTYQRSNRYQIEGRDDDAHSDGSERTEEPARDVEVSSEALVANPLWDRHGIAPHLPEDGTLWQILALLPLTALETALRQ